MIKLKNILSEMFYKSFEDYDYYNGGGTCYNEVFKNPTTRELMECTKNHEVGMFIDDNDVFVFNRNKVIHAQVVNNLPELKDAVAAIAMFDNGIYLFITDSTRRTKWYKNPKIYDFLHNHPFFKNKNIKEIRYFDEDIDGKWENL